MDQKYHNALYWAFKDLSAKAIKKQVKAALKRREKEAKKEAQPENQAETCEVTTVAEVVEKPSKGRGKAKSTCHKMTDKLSVLAEAKIARTQRTEPKRSHIPIESLDEFAHRTPASGWHKPLDGGHILMHPTYAGNRTRWIRIVDKLGRTIEFVLVTATLTAQLKHLGKAK